MKHVKVGKWGTNNYLFEKIKAFDHYELIDFNSGKVVEKVKYKRGKDQIDGHYIFKGNNKIQCFEFNEKNWLRIGSKLIDMSDKLLKITSFAKWPTLTTKVTYEGKLIAKIKDFAPLKIFNSQIDFTYDLLDFSSDFFAGYLLAKYISSQNLKGSVPFKR